MQTTWLEPIAINKTNTIICYVIYSSFDLIILSNFNLSFFLSSVFTKKNRWHS